MARLIVMLAPESPRADHELEYVLATGHQDVQRHGRAPLASLPWQDTDAPGPVVVVPAGMLSWHPVRLPARARRLPWGRTALRPALLRAALDGLLEEEVLDPTSQLHFAVAPSASPDGKTWVAACNHDWLQSCVRAFASLGHRPTAIVPEFAPVGTGEQASVHVTGEDGVVQLVHVSPQGVTAVPASTATVHRLQWPEEAQVHAQPSAAASAEQLFGRPVSLLPVAQRLLAAAQTSWNLAQFDLQGDGATGWRVFLLRWSSDVVRAPQWRPVRWLAVAALVVFLVGLNATAWWLHHLQVQAQSRIEDIFHATFASAPRVGPAPWQMEVEAQRLRQQTGATGPRDFESILMELAGQGGSAPGKIDYDGTQLRLTDWHPAPDAVLAVRQGLAARGLVLREDAGAWTLNAEDAP